MEVEILATESLGVRSMACYVKAGDWKVMIDPGVALGPRRYGLSPHKLEVEILWKRWSAVKKALVDSRVVVITHYHYDHFNPQEPNLFKGKLLLVKDPERKINNSQKLRAKSFLSALPEGVEVEFADCKVFRFDDVILRFSEAVPHGESVRRGYVVQVLVERKGFRFLHTSDVGGYPLSAQNEFALFWAPDVIFLDGPSTYMDDRRILDRAMKNVVEIMETGRLKKLIVDHHLLRDRRWREKVKDALKEARKRDIEFLTAAGFMGFKEMNLEAKRRELYFP